MNELRAVLARAWHAQPADQHPCFGIETHRGRGDATVFYWRNYLADTRGRLGQAAPPELVTFTLALLDEIRALRTAEQRAQCKATWGIPARAAHTQPQPRRRKTA